ncbi:MAG: alpha/beta fold hydrolase [Candidatus Sericytochromatia bacterium]|nr:alpha/beta fold hydrolase [Candidatus Sericytochromatia bacterium]
MGSTPTTPTSSPVRWTPPGLRFARLASRLLGRRFPGLVAQVARRGFLMPRRLPAREWELAGIGCGQPFEFLPGLAGLRWPAAGPRILCIHGWEGRSSHFVAIAERLAECGFDVMSLDGPGHGRSAGKLAHPVAFAEALLAVDAVHGPFHAAIGHSMGVSALLYARMLGLRIDRMVCLAGPLRAAEVLERFMDMMELVTPARERFVAMVEKLVRQPASLLELDLLAPHLGVPGLIVHGTADPDVPWTDSEQLAAAWPDSDLMLLEGFGHRRILREEAVLDRIEAFLQLA